MRKDGSHVTVFSSHAIIHTPGRAQELFCVDIDISERKRSEAALAAAKETAEAASRAKGEFLANMSHELRTPLNAILGFSDLMIRDNSLSPNQKENLSIINRSGEYLLGLINDVLDMAKIEAGRVTLQERNFDLRHMLGDLITLFQIRAAAKGLVLSVSLNPAVPFWVYADESKLRQVIINLVSNAVKFTPSGSVDLSVRVLETADGPRLIFAVEDTGPGIAADDLTRIFEPFVQTASGHASQEGTGLGLPISRRFVQLMGGTLTVTSSGVPGEGCVFQFDIPLVLVGARDTASSQPPVTAHALVNETSPINAEVAGGSAELQAAIALTGLPAPWIAQLRLAASTADAFRILALKEEIQSTQPGLAAALQRWVDEYDYDAILATTTTIVSRHA
jgi:signal transduction histidine kinase